MPETMHELEAYLQRTEPANAGHGSARIYSVAVCGERLEFEKTVRLPQLRWDFMPRWDQSQFFIAPTHMNCDRDLDGKVIGTLERLGVVIAYVKDRRALTEPMATAAPVNLRVIACRKATPRLFVEEKQPWRGYALPTLCRFSDAGNDEDTPHAQRAGVKKAPKREVGGNWALASSERYADLMLASISIMGGTPPRRDLHIRT